MLSCKKTFALCATAATIMSRFSEVESSIATYRRGLREGAVSGEGYNHDSDKLNYKKKHDEHIYSDGDAGHNGDNTVLYQDSQLHDGLIDLDISARLEILLDLLRDEKVGLLNHNGAVQHQNGETPLHSDDSLIDIGLEIEAIIDLLRDNGAGLLNHHGAEQHQNAETPLHLGDNLLDIDADVGVDVGLLAV